jgi:hypothetical protein
VALQNYLIGAACNIKRWLRRVAWEIQQIKGVALNPALKGGIPLLPEEENRM